MIEGKVLKFGYGDICVGGFGATSTITFQQFKPPIECGSPVKNSVEFISEEISIYIDIVKDYTPLSKLLKSVKDREISTFEFKGYIFDFSNYNPNSLNVVIEKVNKVVELSLMLLAC